MSQFLYRIQPTRPTMLIDGPSEREGEILTLHFAYLERLTNEGVVILAGRTLNTDPTSFGIIVFDAETEEAAQEIVNRDPAVEQGVMDAELFPYRVALYAADNLQP